MSERTLLIKNGEATFQRLAEARFFELQRFLDQVFGTDQFGIGLPHLTHQRPDQAIHQRLFGAEQLAVAHGATHDPAQHIAAAFVRGQHAIRNQERRRAQ